MVQMRLGKAIIDDGTPNSPIHHRVWLTGMNKSPPAITSHAMKLTVMSRRGIELHSHLFQYSRTSV